MQESLGNLSLSELRQMWTCVWNMPPHVRLGRTMLEKSLKYKIHERESGGLKPEQRERLNQFIKFHKQSPVSFERNGPLRPGTRVMRVHRGKKHSVLVTLEGFEYEGQVYKSLSKIANDITGKRWNGWIFFGLKKAGT